MGETYRHTLDMGEISGIGGAYEADCQAMLEAGVEWLDANPTRRPLALKTYSEIFGLIEPENENARDLAATIAPAAKGGATGAQMQAVLTRLRYISDHGWTMYCAVIRLAYKRRLN
jgi:hypothetical protein